MRKFTVILFIVLAISGITTLIAFGIIIHGIENPTLFFRVYAIAVISAIITLLALCCGFVRAIIMLQSTIRKKK